MPEMNKMKAAAHTEGFSVCAAAFFVRTVRNKKLPCAGAQGSEKAIQKNQTGMV